ncbi:MAG: hypothetical protein B7Z37_08570 [Verrucomicrobia bacterium 12-59-8]|nr:MAG: hypothetical protein B7Z37_08570 [Verrucomicrobia bacterium 12-59-8]
MNTAPSLMHLLAQFPGPPPLPHPELPAPDSVELPPAWWIPWALMLLLVLLIALVLWLLLRPKQPPPTPQRQPWSSALRALNDLRSRIQSIPPQDMSHKISQILRRYLQERYAVPAPARTTREIFDGKMDRQPGMPIPRSQGLWRERFEPVAHLCDDISFMPAPRTLEESTMLIDQALARMQEEKP